MTHVKQIVENKENGTGNQSICKMKTQMKEGQIFQNSMVSETIIDADWSSHDPEQRYFQLI
jgi:hypothetical protein